MKKIISYILVFFLSLLVCLSFALYVLKNEIFNYDNMLSKIEKSDYYNKAYISVNNHFDNIIEQSGLDKSVLENIVSNDKIKQDINESIKNIFEGKEYKVDVLPIKENLDKNINEFLKQSNRVANNREKQSIEEFENKIISLYQDDIFPNSIFGKFSKIFVKVKGILDKIIPITYIGILVIVILMILVNIKGISSVFSYLGVSLVSSGILLIMPKLIEHFNLELNKLNVINVNISTLIASVVLDILSKLMNFAILAIVIGAIAIVIGNFFYYGKEKDKKSK